MADETPLHELAWGTRADREAFFRGARERIRIAIEHGHQATAKEVMRAGRMARWKLRGADGMRNGPKTQAEWRVWLEFEMHERGRNAHMDLGDIALALSAVNDEIDEANGEIQATQEKIREAMAQQTAVKERVESAIGELKAKTGDDVPEGLKPAVAALAEVVEAIDEDLQELEQFNTELDERETGRLSAAKQTIEEYVDALFQ